jgi:ribosomal protein S3
VVSKVIHQAATTALAAAQLQFGKAVNVWVVEKGFVLGSNHNEIDDLIENLRPAAKGILVKLNVEQILHAHLDP